MPKVDRSGRIIFSSKDRISLCSVGSGGLLHSLNSQGLLKIMKRSGIDILHMVGMNDLNCKMACPIHIGYMLHNRQEMLIDAVLYIKPPKAGYPCFFASKLNGGTDIYYSEDIHIAQSNNSLLKPHYFSPDLSVFILLEFIESQLIASTESLSQFRAKNRSSKILYPKQPNPRVHQIRPSNSYSFEINIFNLLRISSNYKITLRDEEQYAIYRNPESKGFDTKSTAVKYLERTIKRFVEEITGKESGISPC